MVKREDWSYAQTSVIGSALIDPACVPLILAGCNPEDMSGQYRTIFNAIRDLKLRGQPVDVVTVLGVLGPEYREELVRCMQQTPTAANVSAYIAVCREQSCLARIQSLSLELSSAPTLAEARSVIERMNAASAERNSSVAIDMSTALAHFFEEKQKGPKKYISFGLEKMDDKLTVDKGDVLVLGGHASDGKSAMMLQWATHISKTMRVGIFSYETLEPKLMDRVVTHAVPGIRFSDVKRSELDADAWKRITKTAPEIEARKLEFIEASGMTVDDILAMTLCRGYEAIFIDYVQLVEPSSTRRGGTRAEELAEISKSLALMARRHKVLVVELSQLSRAQKDKNGKALAPTMSDLRESGQLEQDADVITFLYRIEPDKKDSLRNLYVAKNKEGELGQCLLKLDGQRQTFSEATKEDKKTEYPRELIAAERSRRERERNG